MRGGFMSRSRCAVIAMLIVSGFLGYDSIEAQEHPAEWERQRERKLDSTLWDRPGDRIKVILALEGDGAVWLNLDKDLVPLGKILHGLLYTFDLGDLFQLNILLDSEKSHGAAAVWWGEEPFMQSSGLRLADPPDALGVSIFVDPGMLRHASLNAWAYILGHELAHYSLNHRQACNPPDSEYCKVREHAADELGFHLAKQTGRFKAKECIDEIGKWGDEDSFTHGSWVERASRLRRLSH